MLTGSQAQDLKIVDGLNCSVAMRAKRPVALNSTTSAQHVGGI
jgi:hypothetical protein